MKFLIAVSTLLMAFAAAQTSSPAAVNSTSNTFKVPSPSMAPVAPPSLGAVTSAPNATVAPVAGTLNPDSPAVPVGPPMESASPFIPPVTIPPVASEAPVVAVPTTEAPVAPPTTAAPASKPPSPGEDPCNVCGGSNIMKNPNATVSTSLFGDISCMHFAELGQDGHFTAAQCNFTVTVATEPCECEEPDEDAAPSDATTTNVTSTNATTTNYTSTNAPTMKPTKTSSAVTIGINGAILAALPILCVVLN